MRHISKRQILCKCGGVDTIEHVDECRHYKELREELNEKLNSVSRFNGKISEMIQYD